MDNDDVLYGLSAIDVEFRGFSMSGALRRRTNSFVEVLPRSIRRSLGFYFEHFEILISEHFIVALAAIVTNLYVLSLMNEGSQTSLAFSHPPAPPDMAADTPPSRILPAAVCPWNCQGHSSPPPVAL